MRRAAREATAIRLGLVELMSLSTSGEIGGYAIPCSEETYTRVLIGHFGSIDALKGKSFIDIGSGLGNSLHDLLINSGASVTSFDISPDIVAYLQATGKPALEGSIYSISAPDSSFDGAISTNFLNSGACPDEADFVDAFRQIHRVVRPGGIFLQAHFGGLGSEDHVKALQLRALAEVGFVDIRELETLAGNGEADDSLAFIAVRSGKRMSLSVSGAINKPQRRVIWEGGDHIGYGGYLSLPDSISEASIAEFCRNCEHHAPVGNSCELVPNNDQARYAARGRCDLALSDGRKVRFRRIGRMMGMEQILPGNFQDI